MRMETFAVGLGSLDDGKEEMQNQLLLLEYVLVMIMKQTLE